MHGVYEEGAVVCVRHGKEKKYDIVLMDHMIPVIDGIEIKEGIKNSGSKEMFLKMLSD